MFFKPATSPTQASWARRTRQACQGLLLGLSLMGTLAWAQVAPGRVGYLNLIEGVVQTGQTNTPDADMALYNQPLTRGNRLIPAPGARLDMSTGTSSWRMEGPGQLDITQLDDQTTQMQLRQGRLALRVRQLLPGERIEIDTPNLAVLVQQPGDYRLDVNLEQGNTRVSVQQGSLMAYGENGASQALPQGLQWNFGGRLLAQLQTPVVLRPDGFDQWVAQRNQIEDQSQAARYLPREVIGYQQLDGWGEWRTDPTWGTVWYPTVTVSDWAPYRYGRWEWIEPWGWTWIDDAPWGFAPFHYGRWVQTGPRWCWVPERYERNRRPSYAPALVGFLGTPQAGSRPHVRHPDVGWVPLAPGEAWQPAWGAGRPGSVGSLPRPGGYLNQQRPDAITHQPQGGRPTWGQRPGGGTAQTGGSQAPQALPRPQVQIVPERPAFVQPGGGSVNNNNNNNNNPWQGRDGERRPNMSPAPALQTPPEPAAQPMGRPGVFQQVSPVPNNAPRTEADRQWREAQQREQQEQTQRQFQQQAQQQLQMQQQQQAEAERQRQALQQQQHQQLQMQQQLQQQQREQALRDQQMREQIQRQQQQQQQPQWQQQQQQRQPASAPRENHEIMVRPGVQINGGARVGGPAPERPEVRGNTQ
ncbi:MAG: chromosome partitioning protein ParA [Curvibacter lanceolatus]|uniref:DUF6600 domain-containing protein n=1 Tax=Curvibacter lanceolatus TaxID=86182 RepID=UPI00235381E5|nr:DUF6600 domain-containing protein [Curvibacter lanceolatus]MBV5294500.1 chromosome partitioning protein ParA [Curvibacter lanceolatus]